jgi:hypothetical protein
MKPDERVLEANLAQLFARAWRPPRPAPEFRARLQELLRVRAGRYGRPRTSAVPLGLAAAAVLLALGAVWALLGGERGAPRADAAEILARGEVAWRAAPQPWRSATPHDGVAELGTRAAPLEVRTPQTAAARLDWNGGDVHVEPDTALALLRDAPGEALQLDQGALVAQAAATPLALASPDGALELESGRARLAQTSGELEVRLDSGRGRLSDGPGRRDVQAPGRWRVRAGVVLDPDGDGARRAAAASVPPAVFQPQAQPRELPPATLRGRVRAPDGFEQDGVARWRAVDDYRLFLLRAVPLPMAATPVEAAVREGDGRFHVPALEPGDYTVFVAAPGHAVWRQAGLALGEVPDDPAATLELDVRLDVGLSVRGTLRDESGAPLVGALVLSELDAPINVLPLDPAALAEYDFVRHARSAADGSYTLEHVARGTQVLRASGAGASVAWIDGLEVTGALPLSGVDFVLPRAGAIEGRVLDADGVPRAGAVVLASVADFSRQRPALSYAAAQVDGEGRYALEGLPAGTLAVLLFPSGEPAADSTPDMRLVGVRAGARRTLDFLARREGARLVGRLLDADGAPLAGRALWIEAPKGGGRPSSLVSTTTDASGAFAFDDLRPGLLDVFVAGLRPTELSLLERLSLEPGQTLERELRAERESVAGRVRSRTEGAPQSGALVVLLHGPGRSFAGKSMSDAEGRFVVPHVRPGLYELRVLPARGPVGELLLRDLAVASRVGVQGLELLLPPGGGIALDVRDDQGNALAGAGLRLFSPLGEERWCEEPLESDAHGQLEVGGLAPGTWRVEARAPGHAAGIATADVRAAEFAHLRLELTRTP